MQHVRKRSAPTRSATCSAAASAPGSRVTELGPAPGAECRCGAGEPSPGADVARVSRGRCRRGCPPIRRKRVKRQTVVPRPAKQASKQASKQAESVATQRSAAWLPHSTLRARREPNGSGNAHRCPRPAPLWASAHALACACMHDDASATTPKRKRRNGFGCCGALGVMRWSTVGCARCEERGALCERRDLQGTQRHALATHGRQRSATATDDRQQLRRATFNSCPTAAKALIE